MSTPVLSIQQVSDYIQDTPLTNYLLDGSEFTPSRIDIAIQLAISAANAVPPRTTYDIYNFPHIELLMTGTLWKLCEGQAAFFARNSLPYSDGGVTINLEERQDAYLTMARNFQARFFEGVSLMKQETNLEAGWGILPSDFGSFPYF